MSDSLRPHELYRHYINKGLSSQSYGFSSSPVWMWELNYKESWVPKNWCFWTVVLEKTLESPLDYNEIQPAHPKGNQSWIFFGKTNAEAETPILWPPDENWLKAGGEGEDRGWDGWMASPTRWTWVWVSSGSWWWTGKPGVLQSMGLQRIGHDWATELNYSPPGSSVHGSLQASILEWVSSSLFRGSSWSRDWTQVSCTAGRFFTFWAIREAL